MTADEWCEQANQLKRDLARVIAERDQEAKARQLAEQKVVTLEIAMDAMARRIEDLT